MDKNIDFMQINERAESVTYEQFGAIGDGIADDSEAIRKAHEYANERGIPVRARADAKYRIGYLEESIVIKTDTDWNGSEVIFDDTKVHWTSKYRMVYVFKVSPARSPVCIEVPEGMTLSRGQTNVGMTFDAPAMIKIEDAGEKIYKRYGENANGGVNKNEMILVDENGNVDPSTPIQYDYSAITKITAYSIDDTPVSVGNARFSTYVLNPKLTEPDYENNYSYYGRGLLVTRSNTTVHDIEHRIYGEDMTIEIDRNGDGVIDKWGDDKSYGVPYAGFFKFIGCSNVTMTDCLVQGHQAYSFYQGATRNEKGNIRNEMGNYDIAATDCINISFLNLTQYENKETGEVITNRFMYHGIMCSSFCLNVLMDNCYVDRFDSHRGVHNATITNSTLGFGILAIGGGELYVENVYRISDGAFIKLRSDYNSVFDGDLVIKNCKMGSGITSIISGTWRSFYNGLPNYMFRSVTIEGLTVESNSTIYLYNNMSGAKKAALNDSVNKLYLPESVKITGVVRTGGASVSVKASKSYTDAFSTITI